MDCGRERNEQNIMNTNKFNAQELCSRKLWQMVNNDSLQEINSRELSEAVEELAKRRHYLEKLQEIGKLSELPKN